MASPPGGRCMTSARPRLIAALLVVFGGTAAGAAPARSPQAGAGAAAATPAARRPPKPGYVQADVDFMSGMIPHHAQAVLMAGWAASHGARADVRVLCERIVVG